ncbi:hypothetical protein Nepgr_007548 [Nepenthes gracilis]|uniref:Pentatricopeptide repeat-containing protein n=1 Tax=Nepenthes gracilis TaxID=150966 RepID=A0AAD3S785_NEPGR|nr:hypothetical protein Nepgr_007548 [Nepenthes gracilis]
MPASGAKNLSSLFRSAVKTATAAKPAKKTSPPEDTALKQYLSLLGTSSPITSTLKSAPHKHQLSEKPPNSSLPQSKRETKHSVSDLVLLSPKQGATKSPEDSAKEISREISAILCSSRDLDSSDLREADARKPIEKVLELPWFSNLCHNGTSLRRKEISRRRKQKWIFKNTQKNWFGWLVTMCAEKLGADATIQVFGKLGRETGLKEYNALIRLCIETAKKSDDEEVSLQQIYKAYQLFKSMKEQGFQIEDETYGPFLMYLIDMHMIEEFYFFLEIIKDENPSSYTRLGYYELLLWIEVDNEDKVHELLDQITAVDGEGASDLRENYLLALCERDRRKELLELLEVVDVAKLSSDNVVRIFKSLGRLSLQSSAEKFILTLKTNGHGAENISYFIYFYATSISNLAVEDTVLKYKAMHAKLEVLPTSISYEKLIKFCCHSLKVHLALDVADQMCQAGLTISTETLNYISQACEESCEFNLVRRIYSVLHSHNLKPDSETFRSMINLNVRMKDYDGAYILLKDLMEMNLMPTASMYNAIMAGYFREKNIVGGLRVLNEMEKADVKPDSQTYCYLIGNSECEEDIIKYYEEMMSTGVQVTKHVFMALVNAYATCGEFDKAKQVVLDKEVPVKNLNEIKSALVSALACHGQMSDALAIYDEIKQGGCSLDPKAIISLIEHMQSEGELSRLLELLEELSCPDYWIDGCFRVILYCVRNKHLRPAIDLLRKIWNKLHDDEVAGEVLFDEVFSQIAEMEPPDLQIGLELLEAIKEELKLRPSRKCLDFLLNACVNAKDSKSSLLIWKEYEKAGLPHNVLSFLRMYQALLASGDSKSASNLLNQIPKEDSHVRSVISACQSTYGKNRKNENKKKNS